MNNRTTDVVARVSLYREIRTTFCLWQTKRNLLVESNEANTRTRCNYFSILSNICIRLLCAQFLVREKWENEKKCVEMK